MSGKQSSKVFNFVIHLSPAIVLSSSFPIHPVLFTSFLSEFHFLLCFVLLFKESGVVQPPYPSKEILSDAKLLMVCCRFSGNRQQVLRT